MAALPAAAQLPTDPEERAKVLAQIMQANARQLTLFDYQVSLSELELAVGKEIQP